jgi:hypothetical protein
MPVPAGAIPSAGPPEPERIPAEPEGGGGIVKSGLAFLRRLKNDE